MLGETSLNEAREDLVLKILSLVSCSDISQCLDRRIGKEVEQIVHICLLLFVDSDIFCCPALIVISCCFVAVNLVCNRFRNNSVQDRLRKRCGISQRAVNDDLFLLCKLSCRDLFSLHVRRIHGSDLHSDVLHSFLDRIVGCVTLSLNKNANLSTHVDIGYNYVAGYFLKPTDRQILTDLSDHSLVMICYGCGRIDLRCICKKCIHICVIALINLCCKTGNIGLEYFILSYKVCLGVYLDNGSCLSILGNDCGHDTFCSDTSCLLLCCSKTFLTKELNGCIEIAVCLCQCLLAVHHAGTGHLSKVLYICCCNSHSISPFISVYSSVASASWDSASAASMDSASAP